MGNIFTDHHNLVQTELKKHESVSSILEEKISQEFKKMTWNNGYVPRAFTLSIVDFEQRFTKGKRDLKEFQL